MTTRTFSYYEVLGVECSADAETVRRAYLKHARECHPDKNQSSGATEEFRRLGEAYNVLSNPTLKRLYDTYGDDSFSGAAGSLNEDSITIATQLQTFNSFDSSPSTNRGSQGVVHQEYDEFIGVLKARRPASATPTVLEAPVSVFSATLPEGNIESSTQFHARVARVNSHISSDYGHARKRQRKVSDYARGGNNYGNVWTFSTQQQQHNVADRIEGSDGTITQMTSSESLVDSGENGPISLQVNVTLQDLYRGCVKMVPFTRFVCCKACHGFGSSRVVSCLNCHGTGSVLGNSREFPDDCDEAAEAGSSAGYVTCILCNGRGTLAVPTERCQRCRGTRTERQKGELKVIVPRGARSGYTMLFHNVGHQNMDHIGVPGYSPSFGDISVVLHEIPQTDSGTSLTDHIQRDGDDLRLTWKLSLQEALCGYVINIHHLDGTDLVLPSPPGKVTRPGDVLVVPGKGMPIFHEDLNGHHKDDDDKLQCGRFLVTFEVQFPPDNSFSEQDVNTLKRIIPGTILTSYK